ncbi:MAG: hypothetical protein P4L36_14200 [Holophaga sp.]|nr:hypothetical protein [Holophaga sp.]
MTALIACPLVASIQPLSAEPAPQAVPQAVSMPGSYQPTDVESAMVQDAKAAAQKNLSTLRIEAVEEAYVQVVAGLNYKLICQVSGEDGPATWEFVVWHRLDDRWQLTNAKRI